jgi:hypothetical protein
MIPEDPLLLKTAPSLASPSEMPIRHRNMGNEGEQHLRVQVIAAERVRKESQS